MIINKTYFKKYSPIPLNYDMSELENYITVAEQIWVIPIIGEDLYEEIQEQIDNNDLSPENATLLTDGCLWQYLAYSTCLEGLAFIWSHFSEVGITLAKTDTSESITLKDLTYIEANLRRQTEFLKDSLIRWLCMRRDHYPLLPDKTSMKLLYSTLKKNTDIR